MRRTWLLGLVAGALPAQEPGWSRYARADGLPHDQVRCLRQDERGYLWIGTGGSVVRHDGTRIDGPVGEMAPERLDRIAAGGGGRLWFGGDGPRVVLYDASSTPCWRTLELRGEVRGRNVTALVVDGRQRLHVATEAGLFRAEVAGGTCTLHGEYEDPRNLWNGALAVDGAGRVLYARSNLALRDGGDARQSVALPMTWGNIWAIEPVSADRCLVLGDREIYEVDFAAATCATLPLPPLGGARLTTVVRDRRGALWLGTVDGLWQLASGEAPRRSLEGTWVQALCVDRAGDLWVGTQQQGLLRASARPFASLRGRGTAGAVRPVRLLQAGGVDYVATYFDGLYVAGRSELVPTAFAALPGLRTGSGVEADARGNLWFSDGVELVQAPVDPNHEGVRTRRWPIAATKLDRDALGQILCTTRTAIVTMRGDGDGAPRPESLELPPEVAGGYAVGGDGRGALYVLVGSSSELWWLSAAGAQPFVDRGARVRPRWTDVDRQGRMWLATHERGLAHATGAGTGPELRWFDDAPLPDSRTFAAATSPDGALWLAFADGLCRYDPAVRAVARWPWPNDVGIAGVHDLAVDVSGRVLVATEDRVVAFTPTAWLPTPAADVLITALTLGGRPVPVPEGGSNAALSLTADVGRADLAIHWRAPGGPFGASPVQYRIEPMAAEFGAPTKDTVLEFASLAPGDYRLELRTAALDGNPPGTPTVLTLHVPPPYWQRASFLSAAAALALAAGIALHRLRVRRLLAMEAVRRQIATDLHDDLGAGLAQVAVLSEVVKRKAPSFGDALDEIGGLARGMRESLSDIVWAVDPTKDTLSAVVLRLRHVANNLFGDAEGGADLRCTAPDAATMDAVTLMPDRRRHLFLFCKEALANAARHARATAVTMEFRCDDGRLFVRIADDGRGFDPAVAHAGHGRTGMQGRATALGARLDLRSAPGKGTTIELAMPLSGRSAPA